METRPEKARMLPRQHVYYLAGGKCHSGLARLEMSRNIIDGLACTYPNYLSLDNNILFPQHMYHTIVSKVSPIIPLHEIGAIFEVGEMAT